MTGRHALLSVIALGCIALQFGGSLPLSSIALALWLAATALLAPHQLRRLWMPRFWLISALMTLGSGLLLGETDLRIGPIPASTEGFQAGLLMLVRGVFLFALMGWASKLVVSESVQRAIRSVGLAQFGHALAVAFDVLPSLAERVRPALAGGRAARPRDRVGFIYATAVELIRHTALLARSLEAGESPAPTDPRAL
jgi:hypothetical protein